MRRSYSRALGRAPWAVLPFALGLPLLAASVRMLGVASLTVTPADVTTGGTATGTVTLDGVPTKLETVRLSSANPALVTVPASVTMGSKITTRTFPVQTVSGAAGCTEVSARLGTTQARKAVIAVLPPPRASGAPDPRLSRNAVIGGESLTGTVTVFNPPAGPFQVQLSSSDPAAAKVPSSISMTITATEVGMMGTGSFPITTFNTAVTRCPIIAATHGGATTRVLLKVLTIGG